MSDFGRDFDRDPLGRRVIDELRQLPEANRDAVRRIVDAAAAARVAPADPEVSLEPRRRTIRIWSAVGVAAAAAIVGFVSRGVLMSRAPSHESTTAATSATAIATPIAPELRTVSASDADVLPIQQQFVVENRNAIRISVVGDFNKWNPASAPMVRSSDGTWSVIIPILPGRHVYGFMVDDSVFMLDPRAPKVRDPDLGTAGSVVIVGRP